MRYVLLSGFLLGVLLGSCALEAWAVGSEDNPAIKQWLDLEARAKALSEEAQTITRADHNPLTADYYRASRLYGEAASLYELSRANLLHIPNADADTAAWGQNKADELKKIIQQLRFKAYQTRNMGFYRERRGLL